MKTERRHELQTNELADWLGDKIETAKPYTNIIAATVVGLLVAAFAYAYFSGRSASRDEIAWASYFAALDESGEEQLDELRRVAERYDASQAGLWARLSLADLQLAQGIELMFKDRPAANKLLEEAAKNYDQVLTEADDEPVLAQRATLGLAESNESRNELDAARNYYQALVTRWPDSPFADRARARLADLKRTPTKAFYDWFARQQPKPSMPDGPGVPGERTPFDMGSLEDESVFGDVGTAGRPPRSARRGEAEEGGLTIPGVSDDRGDTDGAGADEAGADDPDTDDAEADEAGTDDPDTDGADEAGTGESGTDEAGGDAASAEDAP